MHFFTIQSVFLFYSASSIFCGLLLLGLFWGRKDVPARIWIASCFLSSLATMVTVYRDYIPLQISYSLMVSVETAALLLMSQSLWALLPDYKASKGIAKVLGVVIGFFILQETLRYFGGGKLIPSMSLFTACVWVCVDLFCTYSAIKVSKYFQNRLFLNLMAVVFFSSGLLFFLRALNMLTGESYSAFDPQTYNFIIYFGIAILSTFRNLLYIILRMHLGFSEHGSLNNMNIQLKNILDERNQMIASLAKLNRSATTGALSASIAHELNQPLAASLLNIQFLKMTYESDRLTPELMGQLITQLEKDAKRSGDIVRSLQSIFAKSSDGFESFLADQAIESAQAIYKLDLIDGGISFDACVNTPISIYGHKGQFLQVLLNLINNSIQALSRHAAENKVIGIHAFVRGSLCVIEVFDNGPGIPKERQAHLFDLLNSDKEKGMGLGLWLCAQIMENFSGKLSYEDMPKGGAKFILTLPATLQSP